MMYLVKYVDVRARNRCIKVAINYLGMLVINLKLQYLVKFMNFGIIEIIKHLALVFILY